MNTTKPTIDGQYAEPWTSLAAWAVDELGCSLAFDGSVYRLHHDALEEPTDPNASGSAIRRRWSLGRQRKAMPEADPPPLVLEATTPFALLEGLLRALRALPRPPGLRPQGEPMAVHELTDRLFAAYTLEGGKAHVAGCHLEEVPFLRRTRLEPTDDGKATVWHTFEDAQGKSLPESLVAELGLMQSEPVSRPRPRLEASLRERLAAENPPDDELLTIVWVRQATGTLRFEFGEASVDAPFEGWTRTLAAPPIVCPATGRTTFHLTTTDEGEIVAAEELAVCEVTGHRHVQSNLVQCEVTDKRVEPEQVAPCPLSGNGVLRSEFVDCARCGESVPRSKVTPHGCQGCDAAQRVASSDPRMVAIFQKHPGLAKRRWQLAETERATILVSTGWFRQYVVTLDKESLAVRRSAEASRFSSTWRSV